MAPKRTTKSPPAITTTTTTSVIDAQLKALIDQGVARALAARDADRNTNGDDSMLREQWFEKMETVFRISNCSVENQIKFSTCTLLGSALTWRNSHVMTVGPDVAYAMTCVDLKKRMNGKYRPRVEIKKLEFKMFPEESDKIERYIGGLPDMMHGSVVASKPKIMQEAIGMATEQIDKKIRTFVECQTENKRKQDDNHNQAQQQPLKKQGLAIAYTAGPGERKEYAGTLPLCNKCKFHHNGQCTVKCVNCKRVGHLTRDCRSPTATNNHRNPT
nr:hypothetical protein [Tanacetum cinerariifolium]